MPWILIGSFIIVHFLLYVCIFRHRPFCRSERGIFLFCVVPAATLVSLAFGAILWQPSVEGLSLFITVFATLGIYVLSFLECWTLSEGGFSIQILGELVRLGVATPAQLERQFIDTSAKKKFNRLESLLRLGLVKKDGDRFQLTRRGSTLASALALIATIAGFGRKGNPCTG
jgi:hypothetical protein